MGSKNAISSMYDLKGPFTEIHHAFIVGSYYQELKNSLSEEGIKLFEFATFKYAEQRGTRMAYHALQEGYPLDFSSYFIFGEWETTDPSFFEEEILSIDPDYEVKIYRCPWNSQFKKMGLLECGSVYCKHLDEAIVQGFNPRLELDLKNYLYDEENCHFYFKNAQISPGKMQKLEEMRKKHSNKSILSFEYHCAHLFMTFAKIIQYRLKDQAENLISKVLNKFKEEYGSEMANALMGYKEINFNELPDEVINKKF